MNENGTTKQEPPAGVEASDHDAFVIADRYMGKITNRKVDDLVGLGMVPVGVVLLDPDTGQRSVCEMARVCWYEDAEWAEVFHRRIQKPEPLADVLDRAKEFERSGCRIRWKR